MVQPVRTIHNTNSLSADPKKKPSSMTKPTAITRSRCIYEILEDIHPGGGGGTPRKIG